MLARVGEGFGVVIGSLAVGWWLIGDVTERHDGLDPDQLDYMWRAPEVPAWLPPAAGVVGGGIALLLARRLLRQTRPYRWPVAGLVLVGAALAAVGRVTTAGVIGANIGGGAAVLVGLPMLAIVLLASLAGVAVLQGPDADSTSSATG